MILAAPSSRQLRHYRDFPIVICPASAQVGTVASALRYLAKDAMSGGNNSTVGNPTLELVKHGLGFRPILDFLTNIPGVNENTVRQQFAILNSSGDYARIIDEVVADKRLTANSRQW
jgi:hypothetical protein